MTEQVGGDAARTMALLWGKVPTGRRGPKQALTVDRLVDTAVAIADAEGIAALSMRRVAQDLGVGTMSLYTYVRTKGELLEVMVDRVLGEQELPAPSRRSWRKALETYAWGTWDLIHRHPWLVHVNTARAGLGPHATARFEALAAIAHGLGLRPKEVVGVCALVDGYVGGAARRSIEAAEAADASGQSDDDWWNERQPHMEDLPWDRFPTLAVLAGSGVFEDVPTDEPYTVAWAKVEFRFGLERVLDGVDALVRARS